MARSGAQRQSAVAVPPQQTALQQMTQNFAIELSPFPESAQAVAFYLARIVQDTQARRRFALSLLDGDPDVVITTTITMPH